MWPAKGKLVLRRLLGTTWERDAKAVAFINSPANDLTSTSRRGRQERTSTNKTSFLLGSAAVESMITSN